jgi:hypothetical protein
MMFSKERDHVAFCRCLSPKKPARFGLLPLRRGPFRIISFIENPSVIRAILSHLGLWLARARPPPKIHDPPVCVHGTGGPIDPVVMDDLPINNDDHLYRDPEYTWDDYIQA